MSEYHSDWPACVEGQEHSQQQHILNRIDAAVARMRTRMIEYPTVLGAQSIANLLEKRERTAAGDLTWFEAEASGKAQAIRAVGHLIAELTRTTLLRKFDPGRKTGP